MSRINFSTVPEPKERGPIPPGEYLAVVEDVQTTVKLEDGSTVQKTTKNGDPNWGLKFSVVEGKQAGSTFWDNLIWSEDALPRVKLVLSRLGFDVTREYETEELPPMLIGRVARVTVGTREYNGKKQNNVPFDGYKLATSGELARAQEYLRQHGTAAVAAGAGSPTQHHDDETPF